LHKAITAIAVAVGAVVTVTATGCAARRRSFVIARECSPTERRA